MAKHQSLRETLKDSAAKRKPVAAESGSTDVHLYHLVTDVEQRDEEIELYQRNWVEPIEVSR